MPPKNRSKSSGNKKEEEKKEKKTTGGKKVDWFNVSQTCLWIAHKVLDKGVKGLREDYRGLAKYVPPDMTINAFKANQEAGRNRYQDVPCQDRSRVVLKTPNFPVDYINANYVSTPMGEKRFICTQGPLDGTINEFWAMVLQEAATCIVMLCNTVEMGKVKCAQYWPEKEGETFKCDGCTIEVTNLKVTFLDKEPSVKKTSLRIRWKGGEKGVTNFHWLDWPDRGVPSTRLTAIELLSCVPTARPASEGPESSSPSSTFWSAWRGAPRDVRA